MSDKTEPLKKALIVIPTYNERENITRLLPSIQVLETPYAIDILVVDSDSPDETGKVVDEMRTRMKNLYVYHQPKKLGLGKAYLDGFKYMREQIPTQYDVVITMDADFSHHPRYLPEMLAKLRDHDLVVGSRYIPGGGFENWPAQRICLSRFANLYAKMLTGVPLNDLTSGFHCFRREALRRILKFKIMMKAEGYAFLIELKFLARKEGFRMAEVPIIFCDRTVGASKISKRVILESALIPWKCLYDRFWHAYRLKRRRKLAKLTEDHDVF